MAGVNDVRAAVLRVMADGKARTTSEIVALLPAKLDATSHRVAAHIRVLRKMQLLAFSHYTYAQRPAWVKTKGLTSATDVV